jgi:hypothetical protein
MLQKKRCSTEKKKCIFKQYREEKKGFLDAVKETRLGFPKKNKKDIFLFV